MAGIRVLGIDNIMLGVGDLEQARLFYEGVLGLPIKFAFPQAGIVGYHLGSEEPGLLLRAGALEAAASPRDAARLAGGPRRAGGGRYVTRCRRDDRGGRARDRHRVGRGGGRRLGQRAGPDQLRQSTGQEAIASGSLTGLYSVRR